MESCNNNVHAASDGAQDKKVRVRVLGRGTRSKNKLQSPPQADRHRKPTNAVAKRLGRQMGVAHRKRTRVGPNCRDLAIGNWNVSSLTGKEQELVCEAQQYRLDVVGISSTKRRGSGTVELNGGWKIFYLGVDAAMSAQAGVGLRVSPNIAECVVDWVPLGGRVCLLKLRLQERSLCILQVYAPNIESQYEAFLEEVKVALGKATSSESLVLLGDFNAHVDIDNATWKGVIEQHGDPDINKNGRCLLQFCATNGLCIMNTFFQHKRIHKYTWYRDSLGQRSLTDFCIVSADLFSTVSDVRVKRGAELSTDHHLVVFTLKALKPLKKRKTFRPRETYRIKWESLADKEEYELHLQTTLHLSSKNFRPLLKTLKRSGVCFEQQSLRPLLTVVDVSVLEGRRVARKELLGGTNKLKKLFGRKKWPTRPGLLISHHLNFVRSTLKHVRRQPQKLNCLRKGPGRNLEKG